MSFLCSVLLALTLIGIAGISPDAGAPAPDGVAVAARSTPVPATMLTIRNLACPVAYAAGDFAAACREPVLDMPFELFPIRPSAPVPASPLLTLTTNMSGEATFPGLEAGQIEVTGGPPGEFVRNAIVCYETADPGRAVPYFPQDNRTIRLALTGVALTCDWFSVPEDLRGAG